MTYALRLVMALCLLSAPALAQAASSDRLDRLTRDVERTESLRAVKTLQRTYAQYVQFGLWREAAALFADDAQAVFGEDKVQGRPAIEQDMASRYGDGAAGLPKDALHTLMIETPLINLSPDGQSARGRWHVLLFKGGGGKASIEGGIYENDYVLKGGAWRISRLHYYPQYAGPYEAGWTNAGGGDLPLVPYHFTPDEAGIPIPPSDAPAPRAGASLARLEQRIGALNDEDRVRNLQSAYGYYVDRRMWDDAVDLFARDAAFEVGGAGVFRGKAGVRQALERMGPQGLKHGQLNDRPQFDTVVQIMPGGREAYARGIEIGMLGEADKRQAWWEISVFRNRFVKEDGLWKLREVRVFPLVRSDYSMGWHRSRILEGEEMPAFLGAPVRPPPGLKLAAAAPLTGAIKPPPARPAGSLADAERRLGRSRAYDGVENVSTAYGDYLDDFQSPQMGALFARDGFKVSAFAGYYVGGERITRAAIIVWGQPPKTRPGISFHWRIQPVIQISEDGRSANLRERLFQPRTSKEPSKPGAFYAAGFHAGMYHDQMVLEDGIWRMWNLSLDEPYFFSVDWKGGWSAARDPTVGVKARPSPLLGTFAPDVPVTALGKREEHFRGGTGETIEWPGILPMWFEYRNPVSGRTPENYMPVCVPCEAAPQLDLPRHGYQAPPTGPEPDR